MPLVNPVSSGGGSIVTLDDAFYCGGTAPVTYSIGSAGSLNGVAGAVSIYLGKTTSAFTPISTRFFQGTVATAGTLQGFLASTPSGPDGTNKTLTVLDFVSGPSITAGTNTWKSCTGWSQVIPSGVHLWVGIKTAATLTGSNTFLTVSEYTGQRGVIQTLFIGVPTLSVGATISCNSDSTMYIMSGLQTV